MEKNKSRAFLVKRPKQRSNEAYNRGKYLLNSVISNSVINETLLSYLSFADLKTLREVSHSFLNCVQNSTRFLKSAVLNLQLSSIDELPKFLPQIKCNWRTIKLNYTILTTSTKAVNSLKCILKDVEFLSIEVSKQPPQFHSFLICVLTSTTKLTHLQLDIKLFEEGDALPYIVTLKKVRHIFANLKTLDIHWFCPSADYPQYYNSVCRIEEFANRFDKILTTLTMKRLQTFRLAKLHTSNRGKLNDIQFHKSIPFLLRNNRTTIQEIEMSFDVWNALKLRQLKIPNLKRLKLAMKQEEDSHSLRFSYENQDTISEFLKNHSLSLEELDITVIGGKIYKNLFESIKLASKNLRKFHLAGTGVDDEEYSDSENWSFLGNMKHLKDFHICALGQRDFYVNPGILNCLPKNQIKMLSFRNQSAGSPYDGGIAFNKLEGFKNLKRLSIRRLKHSVDDQSMILIIEHIKGLEELEITHSVKLTDAGICGTRRTRNGGFKNSIANLKGLKLLVILSCPNITEQAVLESIKLPSLKSFEFSTVNPVAVTLVESLASQNPNLETLSLTLGKDNWDVRRIIRQLNHPRLKTLVNFSYFDWEYFDDYTRSR